jgi:hypothetical protein
LKVRKDFLLPDLCSDPFIKKYLKRMIYAFTKQFKGVGYGKGPVGHFLRIEE